MNKLGQLGRSIAPWLFWLAVWAVTSAAVGQEVLLASPAAVLRCLVGMESGGFWRSVAVSMARTAMAYGMGVAAGCLLALCCHVSAWADVLVRPAMAVVRATPVASFIILALVWLTAGQTPVLAGALMVTPVVFANVTEGLASVDRGLLEMARIFRWSGWKTWRHVVLPSLLPTFLAACEACVGLCFKATIAAEVIGTPKSAIGTQLYQAKIYLESDALLAWTLVVIALSMVLEALLKRVFAAAERRARHGHHP